MSQGKGHDIKVLNGLIENLQDSADIYSEAVAEVQNPSYKSWFEARVVERRALTESLREAVLERGGTPGETGSILAKAQRAFMDIKQALLRNDATVIDSLESSESALQARLENALHDQDLCATTRETIRRVQAQIQSIHEQISSLKHSADSRRDAENPLYPS